MFFIIKATFKIVYFVLAVMGAYYLFSTNFQPTDFFRDTKKVVENNFGSVDTEQIKKQATEKISGIIDSNKDVAKEVVEEKIKEAVDEAVEQVKDNMQGATSTPAVERKESSIGKITGCRSGYYFSEIFVTGCVQDNCSSVVGAGLNEQGRCVCTDEKEALFRDIDYKDCPGCLFECK